MTTVQLNDGRVVRVSVPPAVAPSLSSLDGMDFGVCFCGHVQPLEAQCEQCGWATPRRASDYAPDEIEQARAMLACPYYRGDGICKSGCVTEPACQTCEPAEGWAAIAGLSEGER